MIAANYVLDQIFMIGLEVGDGYTPVASNDIFLGRVKEGGPNGEITIIKHTMPSEITADVGGTFRLYPLVLFSNP